MDSTDKKILRPRQRENRYSGQITARIPDALKARLEALADQAQYQRRCIFGHLTPFGG